MLSYNNDATIEIFMFKDQKIWNNIPIVPNVYIYLHYISLSPFQVNFRIAALTFSFFFFT